MQKRLGCQINIYILLFEEKLDEMPLSHNIGIFSTASIIRNTLKATLGYFI